MVNEPAHKLGPECPGCGEPWLRPTAVPGNYRCVYCLRRYELVSVCPNCGEHSTIVRMSSTAIVICNHCQGSMLRAV
jgi:primosomal protein N'